MSEQTLISIVLGASAMLLLFTAVWYILQVIANWKIFTKAGEAGWKSIIPFYNDFITYKICWKTTWFWVALALAVVLGVVNTVTGDSTNAMLGYAMDIAGVAVSVLSIMKKYKLSKAFGHGIGFAIGLVLLNPIFLLILGFGSSEYVGPEN